ncbi:MAG: ABC transporter permease [Bacteroidetes bacterium]|nr:ABC transporter permease [Bacteroidota bacterium]
MKSILLIVFANIRRRKSQSLLVSFCIALSTLLLASALGIMGGMHQPFEALFNHLKASHILLYFDSKTDNSDEIIDWFKQQKEVESCSEKMYFTSLNGPLILGNKKLDLMLRLTERSESNLQQDKLLIIEGENKIHPDFGEIWIPQHMANAHSINIGDTLGIPVNEGLYPLVVSATVLDPHFSSGLMNPSRAWIAAGALSLFQPLNKLTASTIGIRLKDTKEIDLIWARFNSEVEYNGSNLQYGLFRSVFLSIYNIIGGVLLVFSFLAVIVSLFVISSTISSAVFNDYRLIGILKSQGFTPHNIISVYCLQYIILSIIAIAVGILGSSLVIKIILRSLIQSIGLVNFEFPLIIPFSLAAFFILFLIVISSIWTAGKSGRIKPVEALRSGVPQKKFSGKTSSIISLTSHLNAVPFLGYKMLTTNWKRSINSLISLLFAVFFLAFALNTSHSFQNIKNNRSQWGFEDSDLQLALEKKLAIPLRHDQFMEMLRQEEKISVITPFSYYELTVPGTKEKAPRLIFGKVYEKNLKEMGLVNLVGRNPQQINEIAICTGTSKDYQKQVNDTLTLFQEGQLSSFIITGIYQDISNMGQGFRLHASAVKSANMLYEPDRYFIKLKNRNATSNMKLYLQKKYGGAIHIEPSIEERLEVMGIVSNLNTSFLLLSLFFLGVIFITIFNDLLLSVQEHRKTFGTLKAVGFTPGQLRMSLVWKVIFLTMGSLIIGIPISLLLSPVLMSQITASMGLVEFPYSIHISGTSLIIPGLILFSVLSAWLASVKVLKINPLLLLSQ